MTGASRATWLVALAALGAGGWLAGSRSGGSRAPSPPTETSPSEAAIGDAAASAGGGREGESLYHARFSSTEASPPLAMDLLLVTTLDAEQECTEDCPAGLRVTGAEAGRRLLAEAVDALEPPLRALVGHARTPPAFRDALLRRLGAHARVRAEGDLAPPFRLLATAQPAPALGDGSTVVTITLYDHADPVFDAEREPREGGGRLLVARREAAGPDGRPRLVEGIVEIGETGALWRAPSGFARPETTRLRTPAMGHFHRAGTVSGLYLDEDGRLHVLGPEGVLGPVEGADPELVALVRRVLRRA
jgi:hypothetical protein